MDMAIKDFQQTMALTRPVKFLDWTKKTEYQGNLPFYFGVSFQRVVDGHPFSIQEEAALNALVQIRDGRSLSHHRTIYWDDRLAIAGNAGSGGDYENLPECVSSRGE